MEPTTSSEASLDRKLRLDKHCDRFEHVWQAGDRPRIEDYLGDAQGTERQDLLRELLALELDHRRKRGERPDSAEYHRRFPDDQEVVGEVFGTQSVGDLDLRPGAVPRPGYRLVKRLGRGGFGEVWKATAPGGHPLALKFVALEGRARQPEQRALDLMKEIRHAHLLTIFASWQGDDFLVIAMELADRTLGDRFGEALKQGQPGIPKDEMLDYLTEAAEALDFLNEPRHRIGEREEVAIQHRDIKPANLLLIGPSLKVGDFGLARLLQDTQTSHSGLGTCKYAAPEFFDGKTSSQSDQYSLAVTYCHMRGGRLPFTGTEGQIIDGHRKGQPDLSMLPPAEHFAVTRALAKMPQDRWPSCRYFVEALRQVRPDPATMREEHLRDLGNLTLRKSYLALRTPELEELDLEDAQLNSQVILRRLAGGGKKAQRKLLYGVAPLVDSGDLLLSEEEGIIRFTVSPNLACFEQLSKMIAHGRLKLGARTEPGQPRIYVWETGIGSVR